MHLNRESFDYWQGWVASIGALVCGRTLFDFTDGWGGRHTMDVPVVVVTHEPPADWIAAHPDASFEFVTDGVAAAVARAKEIAGDRVVAVAAGTIAAQCLELGLLDEVAIDLVPVVLGGGPSVLRELSPGDIPLGDPTTCIRVGSGHPPRVPGAAASMRTLQFGLRVADRERSVAFYTDARLRGRSARSPTARIGHLTMLKLPDDEFVTVELVHDPRRSDHGGTRLQPFRRARRVAGRHGGARSPPRGIDTEPDRVAGAGAASRRRSPIPTVAGSSSSSGPPATPLA